MEKQTKSIYKRLVGVFLCFIILFATSSNILAYGITQAEIYNKGAVEKHLLCNFGGSTWSLVGAQYTVYQHEGVEYPAYCINRELPGVGEVPSYSVDITGLMTEPQIYRAFINGFPYKSASELGVANDFYAFQATKMAIYCILYDLDPYTYFKGNDSIGNNIHNAICNIVDKAKNGTNGYVSPAAQINKQGDLYSETINGVNYQVQNYNVSGNCEVATYDIATVNFPAGTKVFTTSNNEQYSFSGHATFKVAIPNSVISEQLTGLVQIRNIKMKSYPILYGKSPDPTLQNYGLAYDPYETRATETYLRITPATVVINKTERGTSKGLAGAEYDIYQDLNNNGKIDNGENVIQHVGGTDDSGNITITGLSVGSYITVETKAPTGYNLDDEPHAFEVQANSEDVVIKSTDTPIKSSVKISKVGIEDSEITGKKAGEGLKGTKFTISDINHNLIYDNLETDENGDVIVDLRYGTYYIEEVQAPEFYLLYPNKKDNIKIIEVKKHGETLSVKFENEAVKMKLDIEKNGIVQAQPNDEIKYTFPVLKNDSNVSLDNFTWEDTLPTDYIRITKIFTGTYNEDLTYSVSVKTNKRDYFVIKDKLSTLNNHYIDLSLVELEEDEYITDYRFNFGTVKKDFSAVEKPFIFTKVNSTVQPDDTWTNTTKLSGNYHGIYLEDNDDHTVKSYGKKLTIKKLPKTGF